MTAGETHLLAGRYRLGDVLGRGGMADVYRAEDEVLGRAVAVKIFRHGQPQSAARIDSEMRTLASLSHPGLVTLFDAGSAPDRSGVDVPYLVMELVDGPTLGIFRAGRALEADEVARIGIDLARALDYIHARGVVHRDVKPANILVTESAVALTDFGIARIVDSESLTEHGTTVGTAHYVSPEQATGITAGPPSDVYSLGLVLIECLVGRMVFEGSAVAAAVARLHRDPTVPEEFGAGWLSLLTEMTARRPEDRPTASDVARRLEMVGTPVPTDTRAFAVPLPTTTQPATTLSATSLPTAVPNAPLRPRVPRWVPTVAAVAAGVVVLGLGWSVFGATEDPAPTPSEGPRSVQTSSVELAPPVQATTTLEPVPPSIAVVPPVAEYSETNPVAPVPVPIDPTSGNNGNGNGNGNSGNGNGNSGNSGNGNSSNGNSGNGNGNSGNGR